MPETTLETILEATVYILGLVFAGFIVRIISARVKSIEQITKLCFRYLNIFVLWGALPAVVFVSIARYSLAQIIGFGNAIFLASVGLGVCFISPIVISHIAKDSKETTIALVMNSAFMNVSYLGLPVIYALLGTEGLGPAALYAMTIGVLHLIFGIAMASHASKKQLSLGTLVEHVITFPAAFALIVALLFVGFGAPIPTVVRNFFDAYLAKPFFALMLVVVGYQMHIVNPRKYLGALSMVGAIRFLVSPLVTYLGIVMLGLSVATDITPKPALIQSVMPPAIFNLILAYNYKLDLKLYGALFFYLTLISLFIALPVLLYFIS
ncbi:MAG: hypothetical protein DRN83_04265 [Hadesarchaea archaeon]|nr:MAG: hypothetical protein DRN83_04265 [Hadesarchaea archaeon]HDI12859.1 hypothetical protein [Hadesarchaea archaeon]